MIIIIISIILDCFKVQCNTEKGTETNKGIINALTCVTLAVCILLTKIVSLKFKFKATSKIKTLNTECMLDYQ